MTEAQGNPATALEQPVIANADGGAPAADPPANDGTLASGNVPDKPQAPADFPENWREKLAADDPKELKRLERFGSPNDVYKAYRALEAKLSSGKVKTDLPKDATPEQLTEWRKDNGIPETFEGYDTELKDIVIGEDDRPIVNEFLKEMHAQNASPSQVKGALAAYYKIVEQQVVERQAADEDFKAASLEELQTEWGADFRKNVNMVSNLLASAPEGLAERIEAARTPDGKKVGDDPAIMKWLNQIARDVNPAAAVVPNAGSNAVTVMADEMKSIEAKMGTTAYTPELRQRYIELTAANEKIKTR